MQRALAVALVLQCCDICAPIRVPVTWDSDSEVTDADEPKTSADKIEPQNLQQPIPQEYFQYTAQKPQFAIDVAKFHGVQSPEQHYKARPVKPFTGKKRPELGKHKIQDPKKPVFHEFQDYIYRDEDIHSHAEPVSTNYEVFHPYQAEEPGFQELYKDPILDKIRNDIRDSSQRLQTYENEAGKANIQSGEYLETLDETDRKKMPHVNIPALYEIHRPQRRPVYYRPSPKYPNRNQILNQRFRHPWNQNFVKIRPSHYVPLQNHLQRLRQNHAMKYDDEHNEYPQVPLQQHYEEPSEGYDIYEKGKAKYVQLRNNLDESINNIVKESRPSAPQKLELQGNDELVPNEEDEFVPIKNYAQVRKTETTRHLPKTAAFDDAETYEEIKNAPRLREAIKSTKAQTVYTEEGYEDSAYDHAGEQKHASDHEAHAGYLKEKEKSGGKYKIPSVSGSYEDGKGNAYRDQTLHGEKWNDDDKDSKKEEESEDYSENEHEQYIEADVYSKGPGNKDDNQRNKRADDSMSTKNSEDIDDSQNHEENEDNDDSNNTTLTHDVNKRETNSFQIPEIKLDSVFLSDKDILEIAKQKLLSHDGGRLDKYPYYLRKSKNVNENSPLRYAENMKFIPKKSNGGTEFYDSRSRLECPDVDESVDAIPEKLKKNGHPDDNGNEDEIDEEKGEKNETNSDFGVVAQRLSGLGDKIDCFKAKYFGENPLDSPFFQEEIISNPKPITIPTLSTFKLKGHKKSSLNTAASNALISTEVLRNNSQNDLFELFSKLNNNQNKLIDSVTRGSEELKTIISPLDVNVINKSYVSSDNNMNNTNIQKYEDKSVIDSNVTDALNDLQQISIETESGNRPVTQNGLQMKGEVLTTTDSPDARKKRAAPFVYEPYKIIRDVQTPDSKKTTTTGNISPLIKQLQTSKVIDAVVKDQPVKKTASGRTYKDIGRKDRENKPDLNDISNAGFIDVNTDKRRGEPRYELRPTNHKSQYAPVNDKKSMSVDDYEARIRQKNYKSHDNDKLVVQSTKTFNLRPKTVYDISSFLPKSEEVQKPAASNTVKTTLATSSATNHRQNDNSPLADSKDESDEYYDEDYDNDEEEETYSTSTSSTTTTTTTMTPKPFFRRRIRPTTTTEKEEEVTEEPPKLRLVTRFHTTPSPGNNKQTYNVPEKTSKKYDEIEDHPKYREKKKKSTKRTLVTDSKKYGEDHDDDMRKEEIDALIGVKHNMDEYMPMYEKEAEKKRIKETDSNEEDEYSSEEEEENDEDEDEEDEDYDEDDEEDEEIVTSKPVVATTEAPKRTLVRTTDAPPSTTETRLAKSELKPVITKKKIEIHKELPVNKSSPHVTQYKQDIEEEEIIKEIPRKVLENTQNKNLELLELYKDENLAKDVNQLGGVEVFKENLDLKKGPKHGGNYRRAPNLEEEKPEAVDQVHRKRITQPPKDALAVQTENKKQLELNEEVSNKRLHGGNLKSINEFARSRGKSKSEKLIELTSDTSKSSEMHGGNFKAIRDRGSRRFEDKNSKLIELDDSDVSEETNSSPTHDDHYKSYGPRKGGRGSRLHGGNYKSAKLVTDNIENGETTPHNDNPKINARANAAVLLNSFAQAAPILTSTPAYIVDPSKRMYYYVE